MISVNAKRNTLALAMCLALCALLLGCGAHEMPVDSDTDSGVHRDTDSLFEIRIETRFDVDQGQHCLVDVTMDQAVEKFGGFNLRVAYDASALSLANVTEGEIYDCGWEYFNFRYGAGCSDSHVSGLVNVAGIAEIDGPIHHADFDCVDAIPQPFTLFTMDYLVSDDRTLECASVPIRFYWCNCVDNSISFAFEGDSAMLRTGLSRYVMDADTSGARIYIEDTNGVYPGYRGSNSDCFESDQSNLLRYIDFENGGIDILCADSIDARPTCLDGDFDMDGTGNTFSDLIIFRDYFIHDGHYLGDFDRCASTCTDLNEDGLSLTVADLQYMSRIFAGDAIPTDSLPADSSRITYAADGTISVDRPMGAAAIVVSGIVTPVLLADSMQMVYSHNGLRTLVLVHSLFSDDTFDGAFIQIPGVFLAIMLATPEGVRSGWVTFGNSRSNTALLRE